MNFRSHSKNEVKAALAAGEQAWMLDTGSGDDDVLLGSLEEVVGDILGHFDLEAFPELWSLVRVEAEWLD